jgi:hypothetical protein
MSVSFIGLCLLELKADLADLSNRPEFYRAHLTGGRHYGGVRYPSASRGWACLAGGLLPIQTIKRITHAAGRLSCWHPSAWAVTRFKRESSSMLVSAIRSSNERLQLASTDRLMNDHPCRG